MFNFGINDKKVHFKLTGSDKKNSSGKKGFRLNFAGSDKAKSNERNVDSPLFGKMTVPDQSKFLGMSTKMKMRLVVMLIGVIGLTILIGENLLGMLAEINESYKKGSDTSDAKLLENLYEERRDNTFMNTNIRTVEENGEGSDDIQLPSYEPLEEEDEGVAATDDDAEDLNETGKVEEDKETSDEDMPGEEIAPKIDDSDVPRDDDGLKSRVSLAVGVYENVDYLADENPKLHAELLQKMNSLSEIQIRKFSNPFENVKVKGEQISTWYKTYKNSPKLKDYTGKVFEIEATVFKLEKKKIEYYNMKPGDLKDVKEIWHGILSFRYTVSYPIGNKQDEKLQDEIGYVSFTALELPEWLTPERVYDEKKLPLRGKFTGAFYGVPDVNVNVIDTNNQSLFPMPHIILGIAEKAESIQPGFDREMLKRIYDRNTYTMRNVPLLALLNMLYTMKNMTEKHKDDLTKQVDKSIGYFDLQNNPPVMRKVMPVVRFTGELGRLISESEPFRNYVDIKPNPYNIRKFKLGALRISKYDKPYNLLFDALDVEIINPHTGKYVPEGTPVCPETGKKILNPYLRPNDSVEVFGYMLFNWSYQSQEGTFTTAPRIVAFKVRQLPTKVEDTSYLNWIFLAVVIVVIVVVFILVRKERTKATEFRSQFLRTHMQKTGTANLKLGKLGKALNKNPETDEAESTEEVKPDEVSEKTDDSENSDG